MFSFLFTYLLLKSGKRVTPNSKQFFIITNHGKKDFSSVHFHLPSVTAVLCIKIIQTCA